MAGAIIPGDKVIDGESLVPLITNRGRLQREAIYWHLTSYNGNGASNALVWQFPGGAIRKGDWKLIENFTDGSIQLYNLRADIGETKNMADLYPEKADTLLKDLTLWRQQSHAPVPAEFNNNFKETSLRWINRTNIRNESETDQLILIK